jgi:NAD(P)H-hydrate repair Nnr-like enzyme with NAD(P)H-hydrate dehydratase domain
VLAAEAALRAGAGKLVVATGASVAAGPRVALPEARVVGLAETKAGGFAAARSQRRAAARGGRRGAVGPGSPTSGRPAPSSPASSAGASPRRSFSMRWRSTRSRRSAASTGRCSSRRTPARWRSSPERTRRRSRPIPSARRATLAGAANLVVALKGEATHVATPDGRCWRHQRAVPGLATSGSGDVLAGLVAGLLARGAEPAQAAVWAVALHARAGEALARRFGPLGYLARELAAEVPALMDRQRPRSRR